MRTWTKSIVALFAVALMGSWSAMPVSAADKPAEGTGTITGTVKKGTEGAAGATVRLLKAEAAAGKKPLADKPTKPEGGKPGKGGQKPGGPAAAIAETKTDDKGAFTLDNVPAGEYVVQVRDKASGMGGREKVTVTAGGSVTVSVTLKERPAKPAA